MKIALVGPIDSAVSKNSLGGTEIWTYTFAESLVKKGHNVTMFAPSGSQFSGKLIEVNGNKDLHTAGSGEKISQSRFRLFSIKEMVEVVKQQDQFDLIHLSVFSWNYSLPFSELLHIPLVVTVHGAVFPDEDIKKIFSIYPSPIFIYLSEFFAQKWPKPANFKVIYNGVRLSDFEFNDKPDDYFFWMSRISPEKGVEDAIKFALRSGSTLIIAGPVRDQKYFDTAVKPFLSTKIKYVGPLNFSEKVKYYKNATAFLMPIKWEEPFGLVVIEAMACGTPVIGYRRGAMDELVVDKKTGFLVKADDVNGLVESIKEIKSIKRADCRKRVKDNFSLERTVNAYEEVYSKLLMEKR